VSQLLLGQIWKEGKAMMLEEKLVPVYETSDLARAEVIRAALESEGIRCSLENPHQAGLTGVLQCRLFVLEEDADRARDFIEQHE
jgi:hypothetical protein